MLVVMSGLPGVGKSAIADALGSALPAVVVTVDEIEAEIIRSGIEPSFETGLAAYRVGAELAAHQLRLGLTVIADAANYLEVGRGMWFRAANRADVDVQVIEVVCSDEAVHRVRLETRSRGLEPFVEPTWDDVERRRGETEPWTLDRLTLDTVDDLAMTVERALAYLRAAR